MAGAQLHHPDAMMARARGYADECIVCRARDDLDRATTLRWLDQRHIRRHEALGVACCPRHTWRLHEVCRDVREAPGPTHPLNEATAAAAPRIPDDGGRQHAAVAQVLEQALHTLRANLDTVARRFERRGVFRYLLAVGGDAQCGLLEESPPCVLCGHAALFEDAALNRFERVYAAEDTRTRRELVRWRCPRDQRLTAHLGERFPELSLPSRPSSTVSSLNWWQVPGYRDDPRPFVARLLVDERGVPDTGCPACWMRGEHEQMLLGLLREAVPHHLSAAAASQAARDAERAVASQRGAREQPLVMNDLALADLCARHAALARSGLVSDRTPDPTSTGVPLARPVPALWPTGTLRASAVDPHCSLCLAIEGWDSTRLWGLQRAAGSALLFEDITRRLRLALERRHTGLCLPHWRQAMRAVWPEVIVTLLEWQRRAITTLAHGLNTYRPELLGATATEGSPADLWARTSSVLGGYPA